MMYLWMIAATALCAPLTPADAVRAALERAPEIAQADAAVARAEGALRAATGLPQDPILQGSVAIVGEAWSVSAQQPVSLGGAGRAERTAAAHALQAATHRRARATLEVAAAVRQAWVDAVAARQQADLAAQALATAEQISAAAEQREAVGEGSLLDARLARLQREQARGAWAAAALEAARAATILAVYVDQPAASLELPADPLLGAPRVVGGVGEVQRADLAAAGAEVDAAEAALAAARARTVPDVRLGAFVEEEDGSLRAGPRVTLTVPLWRANADGRADAGAARDAATAQRAALARQAAAEQDTARALVDQLDAMIADQDASLPAEARAALESVALGYAQGELDLLTTALLQAEVLDGHAAWIQARQLAATARIGLLLATEDALLVAP